MSGGMTSHSELLALALALLELVLILATVELQHGRRLMDLGTNIVRAFRRIMVDIIYNKYSYCILKLYVYCKCVVELGLE
jgi:hypothetical protein